MPKFDYIIQNPPYSGSLHLEFFKAGLSMLNNTGQMVIIEPAIWLINVKKTGKAKLYDEVKNLVKGHAKSVEIDMAEPDFGIAAYFPLSITHIDKNTLYKSIGFKCFGQFAAVSSLYERNCVFDYDNLHSIFDKAKTHKDGTLDMHVFKPGKIEETDDMYFLRYSEILSRTSYDRANYYYKNPNDGREYMIPLATMSSIHKNEKEIVKVRGTHKVDKKYDKESSYLYGTKEELENWKHNLHLALPVFLNTILTIDQNNNSKPYMPWLVDKQYTDDEIYKMFNFTKDEIELIERTLKKFERNSPWFKRYMTCASMVSDEEVQEFCDKL